MGLFTPAWMKDKNEYAAVKAIGYVKEEEKLEKAALGAPFLSVRAEALRRITDQAFLFNYLTALASDRMNGTREGFPDLARAAILSLKDPEKRKQLALTDPWFGGELVRYIQDQDALREIALNPGGYTTNACAISRITDTETLLQIMEGENDYFREEAQKALNSSLDDYRNREYLTDEQTQRYIDVLINWPEDKDIYKLSLPGVDDKYLWLLYEKGHGTYLRNHALQRVIQRADADRLKSLSEEISEYIREAEKNGGKYVFAWMETKSLIGKRLAELSANDPAQLRESIRNIGVGPEAALACVKMLFDSRRDSVEGIDALRDEAVAAFLKNLPAWSGTKSADPYLFRLALAMPRHADKYGFEINEYEIEDEDQFGRYTYDRTEVRYQGKMLSSD